VRKYASALLLLALAAPLFGAAVKGEKTYAPHQKIVLRAEDVSSPKAQFLWDVSGDAQTEEVGNALYVWAPPGKYVVKLTAIDFEAKRVERASLTFTVGGPGPGPTPVPPGPTPVPPTPKPDGPLGLSKASREGAAAVTSADRAAEAARLALAQRTHAAGVAAGRFADAAAILEGWRSANRAALTESQRAAWAAWAAPVGARIAELHKTGKLPGNNEWSAAFREVADGLDGAAGKAK
jgi:hypothetical protein